MLKRPPAPRRLRIYINFVSILMVAILTTKKTKPIVLNHVIISSYVALVWRNFAADLFAEKYDNRSQSNSIENNRKAIERNRIFQSFSIFN